MKLLAIQMALAALLAGSVALAQDGRTEREQGEVTQGVFQSPVTITPQVGAFGYASPDGVYRSRIMEGFTLGWDVADMLGQVGPFELGLETGLLFSHLGTPGTGFLGDSDSDERAADTNVFLVPGNLVAGYEISDNWLVAARFGGTVVYRSNDEGIQLGRTEAGGDGAEVFPSVGLTTGWALGKRVGLSLRGDYIPTPADDLASVTLGATIGLG